MKNKTDIQIKTGKRIRYFREKIGLTQEAAADKAGYDTSYWGSVERGERNCSITVLHDFICTVGTTFPEFFSGEEFNKRTHLKTGLYEPYNI